MADAQLQATVAEFLFCEARLLDAQRVEDRQLVSGALHVHIELHVGRQQLAQRPERVGEPDRPRVLQITRVVGDDELAVVRQHVELHHVPRGVGEPARQLIEIGARLDDAVADPAAAWLVGTHLP